MDRPNTEMYGIKLRKAINADVLTVRTFCSSAVGKRALLVEKILCRLFLGFDVSVSPWKSFLHSTSPLHPHSPSLSSVSCFVALTRICLFDFHNLVVEIILELF